MAPSLGQRDNIYVFLIIKEHSQTNAMKIWPWNSAQSKN